MDLWIHELATIGTLSFFAHGDAPKMKYGTLISQRRKKSERSKFHHEGKINYVKLYRNWRIHMKCWRRKNRRKKTRCIPTMVQKDKRRARNQIKRKATESSAGKSNVQRKVGTLKLLLMKFPTRRKQTTIIPLRTDSCVVSYKPFWNFYKYCKESYNLPNYIVRYLKYKIKQGDKYASNYYLFRGWPSREQTSSSYVLTLTTGGRGWRKSYLRMRVRTKQKREDKGVTCAWRWERFDKINIFILHPYVHEL